MQRDEVASCLSLLRTAYPYFYKGISEKQCDKIIDLWFDMFRDDHKEIVILALHDLIATHDTYPPNIANVKNRIKEIMQISNNEPTNDELWGMLVKALSNSLYGSQEEFKKLPQLLKDYVRSPAELRNMASMDEGTLTTVTKGIFYKNIGITKDRAEFKQRLPEVTRNLIKGIANKMQLPEMKERKE